MHIEAHRRSPFRRQLPLVGAVPDARQMPGAAMAASMGGTCGSGPWKTASGIGAGKLRAIPCRPGDAGSKDHSKDSDWMSRRPRGALRLALKAATRSNSESGNDRRRRSRVHLYSRELHDASTSRGLDESNNPVQESAARSGIDRAHRFPAMGGCRHIERSLWSGRREGCGLLWARRFRTRCFGGAGETFDTPRS